MDWKDVAELGFIIFAFFLMMTGIWLIEKLIIWLTKAEDSTDGRRATGPHR